MSKRKSLSGTMALRGGKGIYTAKTLNGNFVEDRKNPSTLSKVGATITAPEYISTSMAAALDANKQKPVTYGRGLLRMDNTSYDSKFDYSNPVFYDPSSSTSVSVGKSTFGRSANEFSTVYKAKKTAMSDPAALEAYRSRWTRDTPGALRDERFITENVFVNNRAAGEEYARTVLRNNPALAKPLEEVNRLMVARSAILTEDETPKPEPSAVPAAKELNTTLRALDSKNTGKVSRQELRWALDDSNIQLNKITFEAVWNFLGGGLAETAKVEIKLIVQQLAV